MFDKLKNIFAGIGYAVKYGDIIRSAITVWNAFPGIDDSQKLRNWIKPLLLDLTTLALLTKTPIDDTIAISAIQIVDNDRAWTAIHAMSLLMRDGGLFKDGVLIPESQAYQQHLDAVTNETLPGCPVIVHAAIGLILFLLQQRFTKA